MSEFVNFGSATVDIAKVFAYLEFDDGRISVLSDKSGEAPLSGTTAERFLAFLRPRVHFPYEDASASATVGTGEVPGNPDEALAAATTEPSEPPAVHLHSV